MKIIEIFKTNTHFKLVTLYKLESGSFISSLPITILNNDCSSGQLLVEIKNSLNNSREISTKEESKFWLGKDLLKHIKVSSFKKLYVSSSSCNVIMENDKIRIIPKIYSEKIKSLIESNSIFTFDLNEFESVVEYIKQKL